MKLAMEFRQKMAQKMQETRVEGSSLGGKVKVVYDGQGQPSSVEVTDAALGEGADKVAQGVVDAAVVVVAGAVTLISHSLMMILIRWSVQQTAGCRRKTIQSWPMWKNRLRAC